MIARLATVISALLTCPALAAPPALDWYVSQAGEPREITLIGSFTPGDDQMIGADPLTFSSDYDWPFFSIPDAPAQFFTVTEPQEGRIAAAFLVWSDATPVCGEEMNVIPVDTGTAAFLTRGTAEKLDQFLQDQDSAGKNPYDDYFAAPDQMGDTVFARFLSLPDGTRFPGFSTGWGDGAYISSRLVDASGATVAIYADFIGSEVLQDWIDPPACGTS